MLFQCFVVGLNEGHGKGNSHTDVPVDDGNVANITHYSGTANLTVTGFFFFFVS